jgi:choline dehydrogenase
MMKAPMPILFPPAPAPLHRITARYKTVLSLSAVNTPKVLMQSGIGDERELTRAGIEVA